MTIYQILAAYLLFLKGRPKARRLNRKRRRVWQRAMLARRRKSRHFFTLMQELNDGNFKF